MSKQQTRRKITLDSPLKQVHSNPTKDTHRRPSVFERLGTKAINSSSSPTPTNVKQADSFCRQWEQNGTCQYGKSCKYVSTHALISPSKRAAIKDANSKINNKSGSSSSSSGSSSTGSDSTSSDDTSSSGSSESVESSRHHRHKAKHTNSRKLKRYSSSSDKEHSKNINIRTGKGSSPNKKSSHSASTVNVAAIHKEMKHSKKRRSQDRSAGHASPRKSGTGATSNSKKSLSPMWNSNSNSHKRRSPSPLLKGLNNRSIAAQHNARSPPNHKDKYNRSVSPRLRDRDRNREKDEKEREREIAEREKEKEREKDRDREGKKQREREKERDLEKPRDKNREREKEREREKDRNRSRSPKLKLKDGMSASPRKEMKQKESPENHHNKLGRGSIGSQKGRDENVGSAKHKVSPGDSWHRENRKDDKEEERKREERRHKDDSRKEARLLSVHDDKEHVRERDRERDNRDCGRERERLHEREREKDKSKSLQQGIPSLLTLNLQHNPNDFNTHHASGKDRGLERNRSLERTGLLRNMSSDRGRERSLDRVSERSRGSERDRRCRNNNGGLEKGLDHSGLEKELAKALARNREQDRTFERNERVAERNLDRGLDRNLERGLDRGLDRNLERGHDRLLDRGLERSLDRNLKNDRILDRASPRIIDGDRVLERGLDRDPVLGRLERGLERGLERTLERGLERGSPRVDRDHRYTDRSPGDRLYNAAHLDHNRESEDKSYDGTYEGRRDRGRFSDQSRYDKGAVSSEDRRLGPGDAIGFSEERRRGRDSGRQDVRAGQWDVRNERKRDHNHERDHGRERDHGPRGYEGVPRPSGPNNAAGKRNDWDWDGRGRRPVKDWEGPHRSENTPLENDWTRFPPGQGDWTGPCSDRRSGGWNDDWRPPNNQGPPTQPLLGRPPGRMLPMRDDPLTVSHKSDENAQEETLRAKDLAVPTTDPEKDSKIETVNESDANLSASHKRGREASDGDETSSTGDIKRPFIEKDPALEEVLSDISDDADEILNREDSELNQAANDEMVGAGGNENHSGNVQSSQVFQSGQSSGSYHHRRAADGSVGEGVGNLAFEEISDGELEEEARANRGISDALGVDWASLVAETRPRVKTEKAGSTRQRWEGVKLLTYIGVSVEYAGPKLVKYILTSTLNSQTDSVKAEKDLECAKTNHIETLKENPDTVSEDPEVSTAAVDNFGQQVTNEDDFPPQSRSTTHQNISVKNECAIAKNEEISKTETSVCEDSDIKQEVLPEVEEKVAMESKSSNKSDVRCESVAVPKDVPNSLPKTPNDDVKIKETVQLKNVHPVDKNKSGICELEKIENNPEIAHSKILLHPVAGIHAAMLERRTRRQALFSGCSPYKRVLSARRDLAIRRQLCGLPPRETTCDNSPAIDELFRLSLQLLERAS